MIPNPFSSGIGDDSRLESAHYLDATMKADVNAKILEANHPTETASSAQMAPQSEQPHSISDEMQVPAVDAIYSQMYSDATRNGSKTSLALAAPAGMFSKASLVPSKKVTDEKEVT